MGAPSWKASESWSSNLTVGAGLVNGVTSLGVVSELTVFMTKPAYAVNSMLLGAFVLLAPILYGIARRRVTPASPADTSANPLLAASKSAESEGSVRSFLLAGVLTLWASGGQLVTFALVMCELWRFGLLSRPLAALIAVLTVSVFVGLLNHGYTSMTDAPPRPQRGRNAPQPGVCCNQTRHKETQ
jgi:hypothetical protein